MMLKALSCQAIQYQVRTQGFNYRVESRIKQVGYETSCNFFVHRRYLVEVVFPQGVLGQKRDVTNQVYHNVLLTVGTRSGQSCITTPPRLHPLIYHCRHCCLICTRVCIFFALVLLFVEIHVFIKIFFLGMVLFFVKKFEFIL